MPYITQERREAIGTGDEPVTSGELNFVLTQTILGYFKQRGGNYRVINDILGALEGAKLEFYRRIATPYEDTKIKENGDVYVS